MPLHFWVQQISSVLTACVIREVLVKDGHWPGKGEKTATQAKPLSEWSSKLYLTISVSSFSRRLIPSMEICSSNTNRRPERPQSEWLLCVWRIHIASRNLTHFSFQKAIHQHFMSAAAFCRGVAVRQRTTGCCSSVTLQIILTCDFIFFSLIKIIFPKNKHHLPCRTFTCPYMLCNTCLTDCRSNIVTMMKMLNMLVQTHREF